MAAVGREGKRAAAGWSPRLAGLAVCAFFALGVMTGFSTTGRALTLRVAATLSRYRNQIRDSLAAAHTAAAGGSAMLMQWAGRAGIDPRASGGAASEAARPAGDAGKSAVAIVERRDGFYELTSGGELRGPVSPGQQGDLPVLSGAVLESARGAELVDYAALVVRAEARLSKIISEMRVDDDGSAALFLSGERTELVIDLDRAEAEIGRAIEVRRQFQGREKLLAAIDLTTPGQAVCRLNSIEAGRGTHKAGMRKVSFAPREEPGTR